MPHIAENKPQFSGRKESTTDRIGIPATFTFNYTAVFNADESGVTKRPTHVVVITGITQREGICNQIGILKLDIAQPPLPEVPGCFCPHHSKAIMAPSAENHSRSHSLLLFQKLLNLRDSASPLNLVLDSLEQSAAPVLREFVSRAKVCDNAFTSIYRNDPQFRITAYSLLILFYKADLLQITSVNIKLQVAKAKVILLSFTTLKRPRDVDVVIKARGKNMNALRAEIISHYPKIDPAAAKNASSSQSECTSRPTSWL